MLPNFIVIGAAKSGTTSLYHYLRAHPQVFMPSRKEIDFFFPKGTWSNGREWYESLFEPAAGRLGGEASPQYASYPLHSGVPARMASLIPDVKLIYLLRHPIERMLSHYADWVIRGWERRDVLDALAEDPLYLTFSSYGTQIDMYLECFPREQLLVIISEDLRERRQETMATVFEFIGADPSLAPAIEEEFHRTAAKRGPQPWKLPLRALPVYRLMAKVAPRPLRDLYRRIGSRQGSEVQARAVLSNDAREALRRQLRGELQRLRVHLGPDFHAWGLLD